ncbi:MAG: DUF4158 domain-containing protein, partial [Actinomycetota bacterium]|nr:DUF4158 domain-containing protein [Actinomycetota bacterium]
MNDADVALVGRRRHDATALGYALQPGSVRFLGTFLVEPLEVPWPVVVFVAGQLGIADPSCVKPGSTDRGRALVSQALVGARMGQGCRLGGRGRS